MRKFLIIVLLAIAACTSLEDFEIDLDEVELIKIPEWIIKGVKLVKEYFNKAKAWLKENNLWDPLVDTVLKYGKEGGMKLCTKTLPQESCEKIVDGIAKIIKDLSNNK